MTSRVCGTGEFPLRLTVPHRQSVARFRLRGGLVAVPSNRTAQQLVEELLAQEQPRKFGGLVRNSKYEAYSEILEIIKTHTNRTSS
jgi:hypothetical protein